MEEMRKSIKRSAGKVLPTHSHASKETRPSKRSREANTRSVVTEKAANVEKTTNEDLKNKVKSEYVAFLRPVRNKYVTDVSNMRLMISLEDQNEQSPSLIPSEIVSQITSLFLERYKYKAEYGNDTVPLVDLIHRFMIKNTVYFTMYPGRNNDGEDVYRLVNASVVEFPVLHNEGYAMQHSELALIHLYASTELQNDPMHLKRLLYHVFRQKEYNNRSVVYLADPDKLEYVYRDEEVQDLDAMSIVHLLPTSLFKDLGFQTTSDISAFRNLSITGGYTALRQNINEIRKSTYVPGFDTNQDSYN